MGQEEMDIHKPNWFLTRFDAPIRFLYCRTGPFSRLLNRLFYWKLYSSDLDHLQEKFDGMRSVLTKNAIDLEGKVVLELGPGNTNLNAYNFLLQGAKKVILVDKFPRRHNSRAQIQFAKQEIDFLKNMHQGRDLFFLDAAGKPLPEYIQFISEELVNVDVQADFIFSISVLEHVKRVKQNIQKMSEALNQGGHMYHSINLRDHYNFSNPFLFYKYSDFVWDRFLTKEGISYTNRWRHSDFNNEFESVGMVILDVITTKFPLDIPEVHPRFEDYDDLDHGVLKMLLRK